MECVAGAGRREAFTPREPLTWRREITDEIRVTEKTKNQGTALSQVLSKKRNVADSP